MSPALVYCELLLGLMYLIYVTAWLDLVVVHMG